MYKIDEKSKKKKILNENIPKVCLSHERRRKKKYKRKKRNPDRKTKRRRVKKRNERK